MARKAAGPAETSSPTNEDLTQAVRALRQAVHTNNLMVAGLGRQLDSLTVLLPELNELLLRLILTFQPLAGEVGRVQQAESAARVSLPQQTSDPGARKLELD